MRKDTYRGFGTGHWLLRNERGRPQEKCFSNMLTKMESRWLHEGDWNDGVRDVRSDINFKNLPKKIQHSIFTLKTNINFNDIDKKLKLSLKMYSIRLKIRWTKDAEYNLDSDFTRCFSYRSWEDRQLHKHCFVRSLFMVEKLLATVVVDCIDLPVTIPGCIEGYSRNIINKHKNNNWTTIHRSFTGKCTIEFPEHNTNEGVANNIH